MRGMLRRKWFRFALVGVVNTGIDFFGFLLLRAVGLPVIPANFISSVGGVTFSFFANRRFTFQIGPRQPVGQLLKQALLFLSVTGVGLWLLQPIVILAVSSSLRGIVASSWLDVIGKAAAITVGILWNYTLYALVVFRTKRPGDDTSAIEALTVGVVPTQFSPLDDEATTRSERSRSHEKNHEEHHRSSTDPD